MSEEQKRGAVRIEKRIEVDFESEGQTFHAHIEDISEKGVFVDTPNPLPVGSQVKFRFTLPDGSPIASEGHVAWSQQMLGMGVAFDVLSDEHRESIRFFVASVFFGHVVTE